MRVGRWVGLLILVAVAVGAPGACTSPPPPAEDVSSTTGPPIKVCYEPDGAPCPLLDAGEDAAADDAQTPTEGGGGALDSSSG
jgi:hypothetical protein